MNRRITSRIARFYSAWATDPLAHRADIAQRIADIATAGRMIVAVSGVDCDGYRYGPYYGVYTASVMMYEIISQRTRGAAEGPVAIWIVDNPDRETWEAAYDSARCELNTCGYNAHKELY